MTPGSVLGLGLGLVKRYKEVTPGGVLGRDQEIQRGDTWRCSSSRDTKR